MWKILQFCILATFLFSASIAFKIDTPFFSDGIDDRIVGGKEAKPGQFPYQVSLRYANSHICGGSIISDHWIVTAGHCIITNVSNLVAVVGAHRISGDGVVYNLNKAIVHENYDSSTIKNDIALVQTADPIEFSLRIRPIALNKKHIDGGVSAVVSGWGRLIEGGPLPLKLQYLVVRSLDNNECRSRHQTEIAAYVHNTTLCTLRDVGQGACHGDSGGPLATVGVRKLIGIVSWGYPCARGYPDGFTRVSSYIDWIGNQTGINID